VIRVAMHSHKMSASGPTGGLPKGTTTGADLLEAKDRALSFHRTPPDRQIPDLARSPHVPRLHRRLIAPFVPALCNPLDPSSTLLLRRWTSRKRDTERRIEMVGALCP
jgi:hypothetical protein